MANQSRIALRSDIPDWAIEWLLRKGFADEVLGSEEQAPELRSYDPKEADYVLGKGSSPKTNRPE